MRGVVVTGRFATEDNEPVGGVIKFVPSRLWVDHAEESWATLAPELELDESGGFSVLLTPTHGHENYQWHYSVHCPLGKWSIQVPEQEEPVQMKDLLPARFRQ